MTRHAPFSLLLMGGKGLIDQRNRKPEAVAT